MPGGLVQSPGMSKTIEMNCINKHGIAADSKIIIRDDFSWDAWVDFGAGFRSAGHGQESSEKLAESTAISVRDAAIKRQRSVPTW